MKQNILNGHHVARYDVRYAQGDGAEGECLGKFVMRWAFFGLLMWWIWSALGWAHPVTWLVGLGIGFALVRKELPE